MNRRISAVIVIGLFITSITFNIWCVNHILKCEQEIEFMLQEMTVIHDIAMEQTVVLDDEYYLSYEGLHKEYEGEYEPVIDHIEPVEDDYSGVELTTEGDPKSYTDEELYIMSHVIFGEAGGYSREHQIGVGSVVLNRVSSKRYPNTIKEVVFQKGQYACTWDGNYDREPDEQAVEVAKYLLENGSQYPEYVVYQAQFLQGDAVYKKIGNTYFCYNTKDIKNE